MSLTRMPFRAPTALGRNCTRCFASSAQHHAADPLLSILSESTNLNSNTFSRKSLGSSLASRMGKELLPDRASTVNNIVEADRRSGFQRQIWRNWQPGDVYAPKELSGPEQKKWKLPRKALQADAFDTLGINPIAEYKNFTIMSEYMTEMGRIKHSNITGLRPKNQRKIAKAIRRAVGLGLMPSVHRHPLIVKKSPHMRFN